MFEMVFPDGKRRGMAFDGHDAHGVFMTKGGSMITKRDWPRFKGAFDDVSATNVGTGEKPKKPMNWHASAARNDLNAALEKLCKVMNWEHEDVAGQIGDILVEAERAQVQEHAASLGVGRGKGAGAGALDDEGELDEEAIAETVRKIFRSRGVDDETIEAAIEKANRARGEAKDRIPKNGMHGTGGHTSRGPSGSRADSDADMEADYPGISNVMRDTLGELDPDRGDPNAGKPGYNRQIYAAGLAAARELPGGGVSRRLSNDAALASDEALEADYPGISGIKTSMFG